MIVSALFLPVVIINIPPSYPSFKKLADLNLVALCHIANFMAYFLHDTLAYFISLAEVGIRAYLKTNVLHDR